MTKQVIFPSLAGFEPTRESLKLYARAMASIPRAYVQPHPRWWHISLKVTPDGLITSPVPSPDGGEIHLKMNLIDHQIILYHNDHVYQTWDMRQARTSTELGKSIIATVEKMGFQGGDYDRKRWLSDEVRVYDESTVAPFLTALTNADRIFKAHRATLDGESSPVQFWPHGFDLAFEWYGTRKVVYEEEGRVQEYPSQLNLGFYPTAPAYFYSNPWPFEAEALLDKELPSGASWHTEGWQGTELPYSELADAVDAESRLAAYARRVFELAAPTLMAAGES
ncbi:MAG: hypothetical protein J5I90_00095 [Caldilineales bacterium]|nr:hypothetical protein [Caldilineales bacterium]